MRIQSILLSLLALAAVSCKPSEQVGRKTVPLVREIISDKDSPYNVLVSGRTANPSDDICIIGSEAACGVVADAMLSVDRRDNVDGKVFSDGLLDFSGETVCCIIDSASPDYPGNISRHEDVSVREGAVRLALSAIDTTYHLSPYDLSGRGGKVPAKVIVLTDPHLIQYSAFDIDTLFRATGCGIPVISSLDAMFDEVFEAASGRSVNVGVLCDSANVHSVSYNSIFNAAMHRNGARNSGCVVIPARSDGKGTMLDFLDDFIGTGIELPLDFIVVDSYSVDIDEMKADLASAVSVMNEESMTYGKLISEEFAFVEPAASVSRRCYDLLRRENLFTHNISKPQAVFYYSAAKPGADDNSIILISGNYVQN